MEMLADPQIWIAFATLTALEVALIGEGLDLHIPEGYIYFAMAFSVCVEMVNIRVRRRHAPEPVKLRKTLAEGENETP